MNNPVDLSKEMEQEQRVKDLLLMRSFDVEGYRSEVNNGNILFEINARVLQYVHQFPYSIKFFIHQTLQDFRIYLTVLQSGIEFNADAPVAITKDGKLIYALLSTNREDIKDGMIINVFGEMPF